MTLAGTHAEEAIEYYCCLSLSLLPLAYRDLWARLKHNTDLLLPNSPTLSLRPSRRLLRQCYS